MNTNELKTRILRSYIKPEYFYIPVKKSVEKIIRYVVAVIDNPFTYPDSYECEEYDEYVWNEPTDSYYPFPGNHGTVQGSVYIDSNNDEVLRKGWCNRKEIFEQVFNKIICVKIYNGNDYLGYFCTVQTTVDSHNYRYYKYDYSHNQYNLIDKNIISNRRDVVNGEATYYYKYLHTSPSRRRHNERFNYNYSLYEEPFNIQGNDSYHSSFKLNQNFEVVNYNTKNTVSDRTVKYKIYPYEWKYEYNITKINNPHKVISGSASAHRLNVGGIVNSKYVITAGKNGIDVDKENQGYYMQNDIQADFPNIVTNCNSVNSSNLYSMLMYFNNQPVVNRYHNYNSVHAAWQDDPQTGLTVTWTDDEDPLFSSTSASLNCYYLGDGLTKEQCALYQTIFANGDYSAVGATGISYEVENQ